MKIHREDNNIGFKQFSDDNNLELRIIVRDNDESKKYGKYCVSWLRVSIIETHYTVSCVGDGNSEEEALKDYISKIKGKKIQASSESFTRELFVPAGLYFDLELGDLSA